MTELTDYLRLLFADAPHGSLVDLRARHGETMRQTFLSAGDLDAVTAELERLARGDVYVGVLPRRRRGGGRGDLVAEGRVAWVDLDRRDAGVRLAGFAPAPTLVVASGSLGHRHAYWQLRAPVPVAVIEQLNRRLALALGGDEASAEPARILRPPGTRSHKHQPPAAVRAVVVAGSGAAVAQAELDKVLPPLPADARPQTRRLVSPRTAADPLRRVAPAVYVRALIGMAPNRAGKLRCPLHDDQRPSLHVYPDAGRGWFCFGCRRGGTVYDLAASLWLSGQSAGRGGQALRGREFIEVRERLMAMFFGRDTARARGVSRGLGLGD